jgi:hypothetical protein
MQYFTTQLNNNQQTTHSLRASQYRRPKKRRRDEEPHDSSSPEPEEKAKSSSRAQSYSSYGASEIAQLRVAGLLLEDQSNIPSSPFPHAPIKVVKGHYGASNIQEEIAKPPTLLYAANAMSKGDSINKQSEATSLKKTHLNVLSTVMHRCLLEGDYERAGRAWGMLLRTQVAGGHPVDPRNHGRWGIGAEILLRRKHAAASNNNDAPQLEKQTSEDIFSVEGFDLAREYYERLIIQYPNRKVSPHAVDERTFYPAMFSLWIFQVCEKSKHARRKAQENAQQSRSRSGSIDSVLGHVSNNLSSREEDAIQVEELAGAMEIAERLSQLVASPPFDKQASLLHLRGHVGLWISVLLVDKTADDEEWNMDVTRRPNRDDLVSDSEQLTRLANCQRELQQAQQFLHRAEANGASRQIATLANVDLKLRQLERQLANLHAARDD